MCEHVNLTRDYLTAKIDLVFATEQWRHFVISATHDDGSIVVDRRRLEMCVFFSIADGLRSGDLAVEGSDYHADYRKQLLTWSECEPYVTEYCREVGVADTAAGFVDELREALAAAADHLDSTYLTNTALTIDESGEPCLKKPKPTQPSPSAQALEAAVLERMPDRHILEILAATDAECGWTRHFHPISGSEPKLDDPTRRYILVTFAYGSNLGPAQAARHLDGITSHMLGWANRRHATAETLDAASADIANAYNSTSLAHIWGHPKIPAVDGTQYELLNESLLAEYHIRYGGYGAIAFRLVSDTYIALFSHFIGCGVWEGAYLIQALMENKSDIQPDTIHGDTQSQNLPIFGLAHLLGVKLMPRIRGFKHLRFYRPTPDAVYEHINALFTHDVDWTLIENEWPTLMQVVVSIRQGAISSATLLRKLSTYSRHNRLYQVFREVGYVNRTEFLLTLLADAGLRAQITAATNKAESSHRFAGFFWFGGDELAEADPEEMQKRIRYNHLIANAAALSNVHDMTAVLNQLDSEGFPMHLDDIAALSPHITSPIKRFGDYYVPNELEPIPVEPLTLTNESDEYQAN